MRANGASPRDRAKGDIPIGSWIRSSRCRRAAKRELRRSRGHECREETAAQPGGRVAGFEAGGGAGGWIQQGDRQFVAAVGERPGEFDRIAANP